MLLLATALGIRISYITRTDVYRPIARDARYYYIYANNLIQHGVFSKQASDHPTPDSFWAPAYPILLAAIIYLTDAKHFYPYTLLVQAVLGALMTVMVFVIGVHVLPLWAAAGAGILTACSPHLISLGGYLLTETLFAFMLVAFMTAYVLALKSQKTKWYVIAGSLAGVAYLTNPVIFFLPFILVILSLIIQSKPTSPTVTRGKSMILAFLTAFILPIALWSARGYLNVPSTTQSSSDRALTNFIIGAHDNFYDIWRADMDDPNNPAKVDKRAVKGSWPNFIRILGQRIYDRPGHYAKWYLYDKPKLLWSWNIQIGQGDVYVYRVTTSWFNTSKTGSLVHRMMKSVHGWLIVIGSLGLLFVFKKSRRPEDEMMIAVYTMVLYVSAVYVVLQAEPRYSIPLRPALYLCAMFGLWQISRLAKSLQRRLR